MTRSTEHQNQRPARMVLRTPTDGSTGRSDLMSRSFFPDCESPHPKAGNFCVIGTVLPCRRILSCPQQSSLLWTKDLRSTVPQLSTASREPLLAADVSQQRHAFMRLHLLHPDLGRSTYSLRARSCTLCGPHSSYTFKCTIAFADDRARVGKGHMAWFVCTISPTEPRNWRLCKEYGLWGYTRGMPKCKPGDHLIFWVGKRGYIGYGVVTDHPRIPRSSAEAPWAGGTQRFTAVIPMKVQLEVSDPIFLPFKNNIQVTTGLSTSHFQRGMARMPDDVATAITEGLLQRFLDPEDDEPQ